MSSTKAFQASSMSSDGWMRLETGNIYDVYNALKPQRVDVKRHKHSDSDDDRVTVISQSAWAEGDSLSLSDWYVCRWICKTGVPHRSENSWSCCGFINPNERELNGVVNKGGRVTILGDSEVPAGLTTWDVFKIYKFNNPLWLQDGRRKLTLYLFLKIQTYTFNLAYTNHCVVVPAEHTIESFIV